MRKIEETPCSDPKDDTSALDEEFLVRVDRAMLACKQNDPYRMEQASRAAVEEARLVNMTSSREPTSK